MKYAKIKQDGSLEFAPRNNHGTSNWIVETEEEIDHYEVSCGKIVPVLKTVEEVAEEVVELIDPAVLRITELKKMLFATDYIACKIIEALDYSEQADLKEKYADVIMQRREWRAELNDLLGDK